MSLPWFVSGLTLGVDIAANEIPYQQSQLQLEWGPDPARIGGLDGQQYADDIGGWTGDPNDRDTWVATYSEDGLANQVTESVIHADLGALANGFSPGVILYTQLQLSPFMVYQLDGGWVQPANIGAALGEYQIGEFSMQLHTVNCALYGEQNEAMTRVQTGNIGGQPMYWERTDTYDQLTSAVTTLGLAALVKIPGQTALGVDLLTQLGDGGVASTGATVGFEASGFCREIIRAGHARAFACFASNPDIPFYEPVQLGSAAGLKQLLTASMMGDWSYVQGDDGRWWTIADGVTFWVRRWRSLAPIQGWANLKSAPVIDERTRVMAAYLPGMD